MWQECRIVHKALLLSLQLIKRFIYVLMPSCCFNICQSEPSVSSVTGAKIIFYQQSQKPTQQQLCMLFVIRAVNLFSTMKYYKEIAKHLNMKIPPLNQEIDIDPQKPCLVYGLRFIEPEETQQENGCSQKNEQRGSPAAKYAFDKLSTAKLQYQQAVSITSDLKMDLCLMKNDQEPVLSVSKIRQSVYRRYFNEKLKKKKHSNYQKMIRIGELIQKNDVKTKVANIDRLRQEGFRQFKLVTQNNSQKSQQSIIQFGKNYGQELEPKIEECKLKGKKLPVQRWAATLKFDEQIDVDFDFVDKRWRRSQIQEKRASQEEKEGKSRKYSLDLQKEDGRTQSQILKVMIDNGMALPQKYQFIADLRENMKKDPYAFIKMAKEQVRQVEQDEKNSIFTAKDPEEERLYKAKMDRVNRKLFGERGIEDIVCQLEELKRSNYEEEAYKVKLFKELEAQLQALLRKKQLVEN